MKELEMGLPFFAQHLQADEKDLRFVIVKRKYNDNSIPSYFAPAIEVEGIKNYVYSLYEGQFIRLGEYSDSVVAKLSTTAILSENGVTVVGNRNGIRLLYTKDDFVKVFSCRVVNSLLYK